MSPIIQDLPKSPTLVTAKFTNRTCDMCERPIGEDTKVWYESCDGHPEWPHAFIAHRRCLRPARW